MIQVAEQISEENDPMNEWSWSNCAFEIRWTTD